MKNILSLFILLFTTLAFASCDLVEGIFKAGMVWGILLVVLVVVLIFWLIRKVRS